MSGQIFISYRREESRWSARSLYDRLSARFDRKQIFMDIDAIALGDDFVKAIEKTVGECDVLIAVIGAHWLTSTDEQDGRRLDNPQDFVRREIATALKRDIRVIPVLVDGALMPRSTDLPDDLKPLVRRNALRVSDTGFDDDCRRLVAAIEQVLEKTAAEQREREEKERLEVEHRETESKERLGAERRQKEERERLETEQREKERLEAEQRERERLEADLRERLEARRRAREERERLEAEPQSPPPRPVAPSTSHGKRKLGPVAGVMTLLALVIVLVVGAAIYFNSSRPEPVFAQSPVTRSLIEVSNYTVDGPGDKEEAANAIGSKIRRFPGKVLDDCPDLSGYKDLVIVGKLEVHKLDEPLGSFKKMVDYWHQTASVLEIIGGTILAKNNPTTMESDVYLGDLKESLKEATVTIHTEMTGPALGPFGDLHCALALYALAMDLKHRYPSANDAKEKKIYIAIISRYLGQIPAYFPPPKTDAKEIDESQKELSEAVEREIRWCKEERGKL